VPFVGRDVVVASQAFCNPLWGIQGRERLAKGEAAKGVLADLVGRDEGQASRQVHMIDRKNIVAAHTGSDCVGWAGHRVAGSISVAGNMLTGPAVLDATLKAYLDNRKEPISEPLLRAMEAGEQAGGDKRGRQAAAMVIHRGEAYAWLDLRVDDHSDPLSELRRLVAVSEERYIHYAKGFATGANFSGMIDRSPIDAALRQAEGVRRDKGIASRSYATDA